MSRFLLIPVLTIFCTCLLAQQQLPDIHAVIDQNKEALGISDRDFSEYSVANAYTTDHLGVTHIYLEQRHKDIPVYNGILNLNLRVDRLLSYGNRWITNLHSRAPSHQPGISAGTAVEQSAVHLGRTFFETEELKSETNTLGQITKIVFAQAGLSREEIPVVLVWLKGDQKEILLCWMIEIHETDAENVWRIFIDAHAGTYVRKDNLVAHCPFNMPAIQDEKQKRTANVYGGLESSRTLAPDSTYNVYAMPVESPNHGMRSVENTPWSAAEPGNEAITLGWHDDGAATYTITRGNNVHAYEDFNNNNAPGYSPDSPTLDFNYPFDPVLDPEDNIDASVTNLFYWNNIIHDVMYQYGFDEVSGNFQTDNLGRGGAGGDYVRAEAQDGGGTNNANFFTPSDGNRPRMQMYLWSAVSATSPLTINSPASIMGSMDAVESAFSNNNKLEDVGPVTGDLALVEDEGASTHKACGVLSNADSLAGKIAVIDRGGCTFVTKVKSVQDLGAIAAIVVDSLPDGQPFAMGGNDNSIVIPAVMISYENGDILKSVMDTATVNSTMEDVLSVIPIGDFDNGVITHEYGHGISIRLTGGPSNVSCLNNDEQMGEGWSDYFGLMLTTDWNTAIATLPRGIGTYVVGQPTDGSGIRTYPYTTDTVENPFTYADIADAPVNNGNVSPHFIGSVWCTMLWDMTWKIIDIAGVDTDMYHGTGGNNIALQLVIDALKLQPCNPGFVDGRDALLLADQLRYDGQYSCAIWEAFTGRGLGVNADQGSANDHEDGNESFDMPDEVFIESWADTTNVVEGQEITFTIKTSCGCEPKGNLVISDVLSDDLEYIPGSGGTLNGDTVEFSLDTLLTLDSMTFSYRAYVRPCTAEEASVISEDNAEGPDQYASIKLQGTGTKEWVKSMAQSESPPNSWYAQDYNSFADFALTLIDPLSVGGPVEIRFDHRYETEDTYDGGVVEYSFDDGSTWADAGPYFTENGYPSSITTMNTNSPIAGQDAFTGDSDSQFDTTDFIHSVIRLITEGSPTLMVRFRFVCDEFVGGPGINGWFVDNIKISQLSGITNQTRVIAGGVLQDSLFYGLGTTLFDGNILYVDESAIGRLNGLSWSDAMHDLPNALALAGCRSADSVFVAEGTYLPNLIEDREIGFIIPDSTFVFGGFPAGGGDFATRDPVQYIGKLSGDIGTENDNSDNVYHVIRIDSTQNNILIDGITICDGNANGPGDDARAAAVLCEGGMIMKNVTMDDNEGLDDGQVILVRKTTGNLSLQDCKIHVENDNPIKILNTESGKIRMRGSTEFVEE